MTQCITDITRNKNKYTKGDDKAVIAAGSVGSGVCAAWNVAQAYAFFLLECFFVEEFNCFFCPAFLHNSGSFQMI